MQQKIYAIYDAVMNHYSAPFIAHNDGVAIRMVQSSSHPESSLWQHSGDYSLYFLGHFDNELAIFQNTNQPELVGKLSIILHKIKETYEQQQSRNNETNES